jgi:integrase/recombinase XerD
MLSPQRLALLREWWRAARPQAWLFPGQNPVNPMSARPLNRTVHAAKTVAGMNLAGISKRVSTHTLRHSLYQDWLIMTCRANRAYRWT